MANKRLKMTMAVAEYNPFHNGHQIHLDAMRALGGDINALILSGDFCQRGEPAILDKYTRAVHAIKAGADIVFELPTVFAIAPAEIFAKGAISLLDSLPAQKTLCFGAETGTEADFLKVASILLEETVDFKAALKDALSRGEPFAAARAIALEKCVGEKEAELLSFPNNVLGVEYTKALLSKNSKTKIHPIYRNTDYNGLTMDGNVCSATAIRAAIADGKLNKAARFVPDFVFSDLPKTLPNIDKISLYKVLEASKRDLKAIVDCTEGLENRIKEKALDSNTLKGFIDALETRRYTRTRLSRIVCANLLGITKEFTEKCLKSSLYLKVLAVSQDKLKLLSNLQGGRHRIITRQSDVNLLTGVAKACYEKDLLAQQISGLARNTLQKNTKMIIVKR